MKEQLSDAHPASAWHWGDYTLDPARRRLTCRGEVVVIEDRVFDLLALLLQRRERPLDRRELTEAIWGKRPVSDATLRQLVHAARRAAGDDGDRQHTISTLYGRGLQWVAPVEMVFDVEDAPHGRGRAIAPATDAAGSDSAPVVVPVPARSQRRHLWIGVAVVALALASAGAWWGARLARHDAAATPHTLPRVAIEPIENATGDKSLDWVTNGLPGLLGGLMGQSGDIDVVDARQVAKAVGFKPTQGRNHEQQVRFVTGADVLVSGRLRKLPGGLYELHLRVMPDEREPADLVITGGKPGELAADATPRIRRVLHLGERPAPREAPKDAFLAEAYARGMDAVAHGKWNDALEYLQLCAKGAPSFLQARLQYGIAQYNGDQMTQAGQTLRAVLAGARRRGDKRVAIQALIELATLAGRQQRSSEELDWLKQAEAAPGIASMPRLRAGAAIGMALTQSELGHQPEARVQVERARRLITQHGFGDLMPSLYDAVREIAHHSGDVAGEEAADRAQLAANEELGNERGALGSMMGLAQALYDRNDRIDALALFNQGYLKAKALHADFIAVAAGDYLGSTLLDFGLDERVVPLTDALMAIAQSQHNTMWQGLLMSLYGATAMYRDDSASALASFRKAFGFLDAKQDPVNAVGTLLFVAATAYRAEPASVPEVAKQVDAIVAAQTDKTSYSMSRQLVDALALAQQGKRAAATALLRQAAAGKSGMDLDGNVRMVAFLLGRTDPAAASVALAGFDPATWPAATDLRNYALWAASQGNEHGRRVAEQRIQALRAEGLRALDDPSAGRGRAGVAVASSAATSAAQSDTSAAGSSAGKN